MLLAPGVLEDAQGNPFAGLGSGDWVLQVRRAACVVVLVESLARGVSVVQLVFGLSNPRIFLL